MIEEYLTDSISDPEKEQRLLDANLMNVEVDEKD